MRRLIPFAGLALVSTIAVIALGAGAMAVKKHVSCIARKDGAELFTGAMASQNAAYLLDRGQLVYLTLPAAGCAFLRGELERGAPVVVAHPISKKSSEVADVACGSISVKIMEDMLAGR